MAFINRACFIVSRKNAYVEWAVGLEDDSNLKPDRPGDVYLVPDLEFVGDERIRAHLKRYYREIAEEEFEGWCTDSNLWPEIKSLSDFEKYFEWEFRELLHDLCNGPIRHGDEDDPIDNYDYSRN